MIVMKKLDLYLNDNQYERLSILAAEKSMEAEEYANEEFYNLLIQKWLLLKRDKLGEMLNDPNIDWDEN